MHGTGTMVQHLNCTAQGTTHVHCYTCAKQVMHPDKYKIMRIDQVHYPDQRFVYNIIMMLTSIKKLHVTRNASPG